MRKSPELFPQMHKVVPEGISGDVRIEHFTLDKAASERTILDTIGAGRRDAFIPPGKYVRLLVGKGIFQDTVMSDTPAERRSNVEVWRQSHGRVLIAGLGLGMIVHPIAKKSEVKSITIVENNADVIKLVASTLPKKKVTVIHGDIYDWRPAKGERFNTIYFDIWGSVSTDVLEDMAKLHRSFAHHLTRPAEDPGRWMGSWKKDYLLWQKSMERNYAWG